MNEYCWCRRVRVHFGSAGEVRESSVGMLVKVEEGEREDGGAYAVVMANKHVDHSGQVDGTRCSVTTINLVEVYNWVIKGICGMPLVTIIEGMSYSIIKYFRENTWGHCITYVECTYTLLY